MWRSGELSLAYLTVDGATAIEHIEAAGAAGFSAAGVRIMPPLHLPAGASVVSNPAQVLSLRKACKTLGVRPLDAEVASLGPATRREQLEQFVAVAAELEFRFVQTVIEDTNPVRAVETLALLAGLCSDAGISVALEFMAFRPLSTLPQALQMIEQCGAANVGLVIDALHLARSGGRPADVAAIPPQQIAVLQLCDAPQVAPDFADLAAEAREGRLHPGEGDLWLNELLDAAPDGVALSLEVPHPTFAGRPYTERARLSMRALQEFLDARAKL